MTATTALEDLTLVRLLYATPALLGIVRAEIEPEHLNAPARSLYAAMLDAAGDGDLTRAHLDALARRNGLDWSQLRAIAAPSDSNDAAEMALQYAAMIRQRAERHRMALIASRYANLMGESEQAPSELASALAAEISNAYHEPHALLSAGEVSRHVVADFEDRHAGVVDPYIDSGFYTLDREHDGLRVGRVTTFAMLSGSGKTSALVQIANAVATRSALQSEGNAQRRPTVLLFSAEMDAKEIFDRMCSQRAAVDLRQIRGSERGFRALVHEARNIRSLPIYVDEHPAPTVEYMRARVQWLRARTEIAFVGFDYIEKTGEKNAAGEELRISQAIRGFSALCKQYEVPGVVLAQLNRNYAARGRMRPVISDIRYSGMVEQESYMVILNYSPAALVDKGFQCKDYDPSDPGLCWWIVAKHRGGETGTIPMRFQRQICTFHDLAAPPEYRRLSHNPYAS